MVAGQVFALTLHVLLLYVVLYVISCIRDSTSLEGGNMWCLNPIVFVYQTCMAQTFLCMCSCHFRASFLRLFMVPKLLDKPGVLPKTKRSITWTATKTWWPGGLKVKRWGRRLTTMWMDSGALLTKECAQKTVYKECVWSWREGIQQLAPETPSDSARSLTLFLSCNKVFLSAREDVSAVINFSSTHRYTTIFGVTNRIGLWSSSIRHWLRRVDSRRDRG